jgi:hypothetical protein
LLTGGVDYSEAILFDQQAEQFDYVYTGIYNEFNVALQDEQI